jgi:hypothetical protein
LSPAPYLRVTLGPYSHYPARTCRTFTSTALGCAHVYLPLSQGHGIIASMSGPNNSTLPAPRPRRVVIASSKLVDPQNTAEPIRSHKRAIESKRAAESANELLGDAENGTPDSRSSGNQSPLLIPPIPVFPSPEPQSDTNQSNLVTEKVDSDSEDSEDEAIGHRKYSSLSAGLFLMHSTF